MFGTTKKFTSFVIFITIFIVYKFAPHIFREDNSVAMNARQKALTGIGEVKAQEASLLGRWVRISGSWGPHFFVFEKNGIAIEYNKDNESEAIEKYYVSSNGIGVSSYEGARKNFKMNHDHTRLLESNNLIYVKVQ